MFLIIKMLTLLLVFAPAAHADTIYKSVDEQGNISYSSSPPENNKTSSTVNIAPQPSDEQIKAAQQRHERNVQAGTLMDETRTQRNEIAAEENRIKRERQQQLQQNDQTEESKNDQYYGYPYIPGRNPGRPTIMPPIQRPIQPR